MPGRCFLDLLTAAVALLLGGSAGAFADDPPTVPTTPVGLYGQLRDLVLPGGELEAKPLQPGAAVVLRVTATRPHGDAFRYDIDYYGLESGEFDLGDYLRRKDGTPAGDLPAVPVRFTAALAPERITPNEPAAGELPKVGGYKALLIAGGIAWALGLLALIFVGRKRRAAAEGRPGAPPPTLADRLRPLVKAARDGTLDKAGQAELERTLLGFWRQKLDLADESPATALAKLRHHERAAPLLEQLETWLHNPNPKSPTDIDALLTPYAKTRSDH